MFIIYLDKYIDSETFYYIYKGYAITIIFNLSENFIWGDGIFLICFKKARIFFKNLVFMSLTEELSENRRVEKPLKLSWFISKTIIFQKEFLRKKDDDASINNHATILITNECNAP